LKVQIKPISFQYLIVKYFKKKKAMPVKTNFWGSARLCNLCKSTYDIFGSLMTLQSFRAFADPDKRNFLQFEFNVDRCQMSER
jgi:hypothetical protein